MLLGVTSVDCIVDRLAFGPPRAEVNKTAINKGSEEFDQFFLGHIWSIPSEEKEKVRTPVREPFGEFVDGSN